MNQCARRLEQIEPESSRKDGDESVALDRIKRAFDKCRKDRKEELCKLVEDLVLVENLNIEKYDGYWCIS